MSLVRPINPDTLDRRQYKKKCQADFGGSVRRSLLSSIKDTILLPVLKLCLKYQFTRMARLTVPEKLKIPDNAGLPVLKTTLFVPAINTYAPFLWADYAQRSSGVHQDVPYQLLQWLRSFRDCLETKNEVPVCSSV